MILVDYSHFDNSISLLLKDFVGFSNLGQWETVGDERCGVNLQTCLYLYMYMLSLS